MQLGVAYNYGPNFEEHFITPLLKKKNKLNKSLVPLRVVDDLMKAVAIGCYFERPNKVQRSSFDFPISADSERDSKLVFKETPVLKPKESRHSLTACQLNNARTISG